MSSLKDNLLKMALNKRQARLAITSKEENDHKLLEEYQYKTYRFEDYPEYKAILQKQQFCKKFNIDSPFFISHEGLASSATVIDGKTFINFSSYNYLNLNGDWRVNEVARQAIERYGISASASRLVSGERPIHRELESAIANLYGVDDALLFVSGHATNMNTIGYLFDKKDLILHDEFMHDSALQGIKLSGAFRLSFPHNDWQALADILATRRHQFERVLIIIEGLYSMDGDYPDLPAFIEVKKRYKAFLMVDEAHSLGVMGESGAGIGDFFAIDKKEVDIWMGTLSKSLAGCGGYIAGSKALVEHLRYKAPGFLYSVGMPPLLAAASLKALELMLEEPWRVQTLNNKASYFLKEAQNRQLNTGFSQGLAIIPIILGSSKKAVVLSNHLHNKGVNVQPIIYPAVPDNQARLRFFINCNHEEEQINYTLKIISDYHV